MLTLYGTRARARRRPKRRSRSPACPIDGRRRVVAAVARLDELKRVNPIAQIPTLVLDDGSVLTESAAILIHLGLAHPESGLSPSDPARRAQQIRGLVYIAANCYAGIGILDYPERWYPDPDDAVKKAMQARGRARLHELWEIFADQFPATPWLSGERLGALDILAATVSKWSGARKALAESRPEFAALLGAHRGRSAHRRGLGAALAEAGTGRGRRRDGGVLAASPHPSQLVEDEQRRADRDRAVGDVERREVVAAASAPG